jgi:hypothetical protein
LDPSRAAKADEPAEVRTTAQFAKVVPAAFTEPEAGRLTKRVEAALRVMTFRLSVRAADGEVSEMTGLVLALSVVAV